MARKEACSDEDQGTDSSREDLESFADRREKEAKSALDELLSDKSMEFCSRCNRKVGSRVDWAGKCWWEGCKGLLCHECWGIHKFRFCRDHAKSIAGDSEEQPIKKAPEPVEEPVIKADLRAMIDAHQEDMEARLRYLTQEFASWLMKRMEKQGPIDWTPREAFENAQVARKEGAEGEIAISVSIKKWLRRKVKLSILISSIESADVLDANSLMALLRRLARKHKGFKLFVLVADGAKLDVVSFANRFIDPDFCMFLVEPRAGNLYYNLNDPITSGYSSWFSQKKDAYAFRERLKRQADLVSGRLVISEKVVTKEFGFLPSNAERILRSCRFLVHVPETDTYFWKDEKQA